MLGFFATLRRTFVRTAVSQAHDAALPPDVRKGSPFRERHSVMLSEAKHLCISLETNAGILRYAQNDIR